MVNYVHNLLRNLFIAIVLLPFSLLSQTDSLKKQQKLDSLRLQLAADSNYIYRFRKVRPYVNYHERHSLFKEFATNFWGPQLGVVLYERHIVCGGIYFSGVQTRQPVTITDNNIKASRKINVNFYSLYYQYILVNKRFVQVELPVEFSHGNYSAEFRDSSSKVYRTIDNPLWLAGGGIIAILKPVRWIGLSGMYGYRYTSEELFDGFYYTFGVWLNIRQVINDGRYYLIRKKQYRKNVAEICKS